MKHLNLALCAMAALAWFASAAQAQDRAAARDSDQATSRPAGESRGGGATGEGRGAGATGDRSGDKASETRDRGAAPAGDRAAGETRERGDKGKQDPAMRGDEAQKAEACGLTDDQKKKIAELREACQKAVQETQTQYTEQISAVFTPDQRDKWNQATVLSQFQNMLKKVNATDEQMTKIKAVIADETKGMTTIIERGGSLGEKTSKISSAIMDILTDDQKAMLKAGQGQRGEGEKREAPKDAPTTGGR